MNKFPLPEFKGNPLLFHAVTHSNVKETVQLLEEKEADVNARNLNGFTPLHFAVQCEFPVVVRILLHYRADPNLKDYFDVGQKTPLHYAVEKNNYEISKQLLDAGASAVAQDKRGLSPLHYAARFGDREIIQLLLAHGADLNQRDSNGFNAAHWAKLNEHVDLLELLGPPKAIGPGDYLDFKKQLWQIHGITGPKKKGKKGKKK